MKPPTYVRSPHGRALPQVRRFLQDGSESGLRRGAAMPGAEVALAARYLAFLSNDACGPAWLRELLVHSARTSRTAWSAPGPRCSAGTATITTSSAGVMATPSSGWRRGPTSFLSPWAGAYTHGMSCSCLWRLVLIPHVYPPPGFDPVLRLLRGCGPGLAAVADGPPRHGRPPPARALITRHPTGQLSAIPITGGWCSTSATKLYALYKNYSDENHKRDLPAALALLSTCIIASPRWRGWAHSTILTNALPARRRAGDHTVHPQAISTLLAASEFVDNLPVLAPNG